MGVPKFYRWISERYPCLSEPIKDHQVTSYLNYYIYPYFIEKYLKPFKYLVILYYIKYNLLL